MENAFKIIGKFFFPVTCIISGLFFLINGEGQTSYYTFGAIAVLLVGILSLLFVIDVIKRKVLIIFTLLFLVGSGLFSYFNYQSVDVTMKEMAQKKRAKSKVIQGLKDMRTAQIAYLEKNGVYTEDLNELLSFVKTGTIPAIKKIGTIPDSVGTEAMAREAGLIVNMPEGMTDEEALAQGLIIRDTVQISVLESLFMSETALKKRKFDLEVDKLIYSPESGKKWIVKAGKLTTGGVEKPFLLVKDPEPYYDGAAMAVGSTEEANTNGNWKED